MNCCWAQAEWAPVNMRSPMVKEHFQSGIAISCLSTSVSQFPNFAQPAESEKIPPNISPRLAMKAGLLLIVRSGRWVLDELLFQACQLRRSKLERHLGDLASEAERNLVVLVVHRRTGVHADIEGLVDGQEGRNC